MQVIFTFSDSSTVTCGAGVVCSDFNTSIDLTEAVPGDLVLENAELKLKFDPKVFPDTLTAANNDMQKVSWIIAQKTGLMRNIQGYTAEYGNYLIVNHSISQVEVKNDTTTLFKGGIEKDESISADMVSGELDLNLISLCEEQIELDGPVSSEAVGSYDSDVFAERENNYMPQMWRLFLGHLKARLWETGNYIIQIDDYELEQLDFWAKSMLTGEILADSELYPYPGLPSPVEFVSWERIVSISDLNRPVTEILKAVGAFSESIVYAVGDKIRFLPMCAQAPYDGNAFYILETGTYSINHREMKYYGVPDAYNGFYVNMYDKATWRAWDTELSEWRYEQSERHWFSDDLQTVFADRKNEVEGSYSLLLTISGIIPISLINTRVYLGSRLILRDANGVISNSGVVIALDIDYTTLKSETVVFEATIRTIAMRYPGSPNPF